MCMYVCKYVVYILYYIYVCKMAESTTYRRQPRYIHYLLILPLPAHCLIFHVGRYPCADELISGGRDAEKDDPRIYSAGGQLCDHLAALATTRGIVLVVRE